MPIPFDFCADLHLGVCCSVNYEAGVFPIVKLIWILSIITSTVW